jgi:Flp pilus assembly protein TadG
LLGYAALDEVDLLLAAMLLVDVFSDFFQRQPTARLPTCSRLSLAGSIVLRERRNMFQRHKLGNYLVALMRRLVGDRAGNSLILTGALLVPLFALIGSGVDVGRVYVARSRMQQACDASALAGRWAFSQGATTSTGSAEAVKFFNFNFPQKSFGTAPFTPTVTVTGSTTKVVAVSASTTMPMALMNVFGVQPMTVSATCTAQQDYVNTDIVLVLDVTGSMAAKASSADTQTKIEALRSAALALYDQLAPIQTQLEAAGMRLRYSIVPYSSTVNVGKLLYAVNSSYIQTSSKYYHKDCTQYYSDGTCKTSTSPYQKTVTHDSIWLTSNSWNGCIEERQTTSSITSSTTAIPAAAYDLDVDKKPDTADATTQWVPYDPAPGAENANGQTACPIGAKRLQAWARSDLLTYLNSLSPDGGTYHDIGMIWGARMISSGGVFGDSLPTYNNMPTNKFVIFMTDGLLDTGPDLYSAYGVERYDQRVTGSGNLSSQDSRHQQRFNLMCSRVKNMGASVWVVAFSQALDTNLINCASNPGQASTSANSVDLIAKFKDIGKNIGALRLTQ